MSAIFFDQVKTGGNGGGEWEEFDAMFLLSSWLSPLIIFSSTPTFSSHSQLCSVCGRLLQAQVVAEEPKHLLVAITLSLLRCGNMHARGSPSNPLATFRRSTARSTPGAPPAGRRSRGQATATSGASLCRMLLRLLLVTRVMQENGTSSETSRHVQNVSRCERKASWARAQALLCTSRTYWH